MRKTGFSTPSYCDPALEELEAMQRVELPEPGDDWHRNLAKIRIPERGECQQSKELLERMYANNFVVREKKPFVIDTRHSRGAYLSSVDDSTFTIYDACSQQATLTHGCGNDHVLHHALEGLFDQCLWANPDSRVNTDGVSHEILEAYRQVLLSHAPGGLTDVSFVAAGGAEANEKALRLARLQAKKPQRQTRVLAFRSSCHGRTWVPLGATWNSAKRQPFEMSGFEAVFCEPTVEAVAQALDAQGQQIYAAIVEPMMAEGGDVYLDRTFLEGLRALTRQYEIPLIVDEVQTGFSTGETFFWWNSFDWTSDPHSAPDFLTCAKKAGLGVVISTTPDPEPTSVHLASAVRGRIAAETAIEQNFIGPVLRASIEQLAAEYPTLVGSPRTSGITAAFDLPSEDDCNKFIAQRFRRGFMTYPAGSRTIQFRLNASWTERELGDLFRRIGEALTLLHDDEATSWRAEQSSVPQVDFRIREINPDDWPAIMSIEHAVFEPERADTEEYLKRGMQAGLGLVAEDKDDNQILGFCIGGALEAFPDVGGVKEDPKLGHRNTFYSTDVSVAPQAHGRGIGRTLKQAQLDWARVQGFLYVTGRNRVGVTTAMAALNRSLGARILYRVSGQYGGDGEADYYRIVLKYPRIKLKTEEDHSRVDFASGIESPLGASPSAVTSREVLGPLTSKLNLSNWATLDSVHYCEHLRAIAPRSNKHLYFTSSRDEMLDKALRCIRLSRPTAQIAIGLEGGYFGHNTAAARSISDSSGFGPNFELFNWPRIPHPAGSGSKASVEALAKRIEQYGAGSILALVIEVIGERSGQVVTPTHAAELVEVCQSHDIPVVVSETASGGYRSTTGAWLSDTWPTDTRPDVVLWYPGGQLGHVFVNDRYWIDKPLALLSTWDGDELSMIRAHELLRVGNRLDLSAAERAVSQLVKRAITALQTHGEPEATSLGAGLYRSLTVSSSRVAQSIIEQARTHGLTLAEGLPGTILLAPALTISTKQVQAATQHLLRSIQDALAVMD